MVDFSSLRPIHFQRGKPPGAARARPPIEHYRMLGNLIVAPEKPDRREEKKESIVESSVAGTSGGMRVIVWYPTANPVQIISGTQASKVYKSPPIPAKLRHIAWSFESDECDALNDRLQLAPQAFSALVSACRPLCRQVARRAPARKLAGPPGCLGRYCVLLF